MGLRIVDRRARLRAIGWSRNRTLRQIDVEINVRRLIRVVRRMRPGNGT